MGEYGIVEAFRDTFYAAQTLFTHGADHMPHGKAMEIRETLADASAVLSDALRSRSSAAEDKVDTRCPEFLTGPGIAADLRCELEAGHQGPHVVPPARSDAEHDRAEWGGYVFQGCDRPAPHPDHEWTASDGVTVVCCNDPQTYGFATDVSGDPTTCSRHSFWHYDCVGCIEAKERFDGPNVPEEPTLDLECGCGQTHHIRVQDGMFRVTGKSAQGSAAEAPAAAHFAIIDKGTSPPCHVYDGRWYYSFKEADDARKGYPFPEGLDVVSSNYYAQGAARSADVTGHNDVPSGGPGQQDGVPHHERSEGAGGTPEAPTSSAPYPGTPWWGEDPCRCSTHLILTRIRDDAALREQVIGSLGSAEREPVFGMAIHLLELVTLSSDGSIGITGATYEKWSRMRDAVVDQVPTVSRVSQERAE